VNCSRCQTEIPPHCAQCPSCKKWILATTVSAAAFIRLSDVKGDVYPRVISGFCDPCFAEPPGIVTSAAILLGGMPGAGKSTLSLQLADGIADSTGGDVLYLPTEETPDQIRPRAVRLDVRHMDRLVFVNEVDTDLERLEAIIKEIKPRAIFLDSISGLTRNLEDAVTFCMGVKGFAQRYNAPAIFTAHITKDDDFAGLMKLQHAVDAIIGLTLRGNDDVRVLGGYKNRFGPTDKNRDISMSMTEKGLVPYVKPERKKKSKKVTLDEEGF